MPVSTIEIDGLIVRVRGPLHVGTGFARGLVDKTVTRSSDGLVYVPGSALKGKVRDACEQLARLYDISNCRSPHPQAMAEHRDTCLICRIFGAPAQPATLRWHSATLTQDWIQTLRPDATSRATFGQARAQTQVQLSRARGLAAEARLFTSEYAAEGLTFAAHPALTGWTRLTPVSLADDPDIYYELVLLLAGIRMVNALGGSLSRGAGECRIELPDTILINGRDVRVDQQLKYVEVLGLYQSEVEAKT